MKNYFKDNLIIIGPSYMKKNIITQNIYKYNIKYIDEYELQAKLLYEYKDGTLAYIDKKYNFIPEIGKIILNNLYEIDINKEYNSKKLNNLVNIKIDLINNDNIKYDRYFDKFMTNKEMIVLDNFFDAKIKKLIKNLEEKNNVKYIENHGIKKESIDVYEFKTLEEEVCYVASKIVDLINDGIDINKIKINRFNNDYKTTIIRVFDAYGIPYQFIDNKMYMLEEVKYFLSKLDDNMSLIEINVLLESLNINNKVNDKIVSVFNKYVDYNRYADIKEEIIYEFKNTTISLMNYEDVVKIIDYKNYQPNDDEYIFILGLNQDEIPTIHKDNRYLNDLELKELDSDTSFELNKRELEYFIWFINNTKNIILSYKISSNFNEYMPANALKEIDNIRIIKKTYDYDNDEINRMILAKRLDNYIKYNEVSDDLYELYSAYNDDKYNSYNNNYNGIDIDTIKKQLDNKINLSYTNTNTFFKCKFRFLLDTIYKLSPYEETVSQKIGNLFHDVLCTVYKDKLNYQKVMDDKINEYFKDNTKKELFYIEKYKEVLNHLIECLDEQLDRTNYENSYFEEWFSIEKENDLNFKIVGKIDKILTLKDENNTYVIVIDYKTGSIHSDFNKVIHGFDMQLLYYLYLIKNTAKIANPKFTGMYLQSIMSEVLNSEKNKKYAELLKDTMKLFGYTIDDTSKLYKIDNEYDNDSYIRGIKVKNDGSFYAYSKVLSEETINSLIDIVDNNLNEVMESIKTSDFAINPKKLGNDLVGCEYCKFKDICYMNNDNIVELETYKDLEFLGGDDSDTN